MRGGYLDFMQIATLLRFAFRHGHLRSFGRYDLHTDSLDLSRCFRRQRVCCSVEG